MRAKGFDVWHPMGSDAFGLPAENAAAQTRVHPAQWTYANIAAMRAQLKTLGARRSTVARDRDLRSEYYDAEQSLFLDLLKPALFDREVEGELGPVDMTVLANEQVIDGRGWRSARSSSSAATQWLQDHRRFRRAARALDGSIAGRQGR